ncbi:MAG: exodeoxyribonuclease VII small subunit [Acidimicrobiales bacterium]|jgi:exonuclease VII small subunit
MSKLDPSNSPVPVGELGYAEASEELDAIIAELEDGVIDVDLLEVRLRRAVEIVEELDRRIRGAREKVGSLLPRLEAVGQDASHEVEGG